MGQSPSKNTPIAQPEAAQPKRQVTPSKSDGVAYSPNFTPMPSPGGSLPPSLVQHLEAAGPVLALIASNVPKTAPADKPTPDATLAVPAAAPVIEVPKKPATVPMPKMQMDVPLVDKVPASVPVVSLVAPASIPAPAPRMIELSDTEWREKLTAEEYRVLREKATEKEGTGEYDRFFPVEGYFVCRACGNPLYSKDAKFKAGCGWPSFDRCYVGSVRLEPDLSHGLQRVEVTCVECKSHLGHVFEGEKLTESDQRHCINSMSIRYVKEIPPGWLEVRGEGKIDTSKVCQQLKLAAPAAPAAPSRNRPASDLDMSDAALATAWEAIKGQEGGWCVCSYVPNSKTKIVLISHGTNGITELRRHLVPDAVSYGALPASVDGRPRSVFFTFVGEETSAMKRGRASVHSPHVEKYFQGTVGALPVISSNGDFDDGALNGLLMQLCKGAASAHVC